MPSSTPTEAHALGGLRVDDLAAHIAGRPHMVHLHLVIFGLNSGAKFGDTIPISRKREKDNVPNTISTCRGMHGLQCGMIAQVRSTSSKAELALSPAGVGIPATGGVTKRPVTLL
jgi:hypothetical protein